MSPENSSLAVRLLNAFEHFYRENAGLRMILTDHRVPGWERRLQELMDDPKPAAFVRDQFSEVRSALIERGDPARALQALLKVFPPNKDLN
jgi:hypothetical protein